MKKLTQHIKTYLRELKKNSKKNYQQHKIKFLENDIQNIWIITKEIIGKNKCNNETLPKHLIVDNIGIHDAKSIAEKFNEFFANDGPNVANKITQCDLTFKLLKFLNLPTVNTTLNETV